MNFGKFSSVLFALVQDDCYSRLRQIGRRGEGGGGGEYLSRHYVMMKRLENLLLDTICYSSFDKVLSVRESSPTLAQQRSYP